MALNDGAKQANLKRSLDLYCKATFGVSEGLSVSYEGLPFDDTAFQNWVQPRIVGGTRKFYRSGSSTEYAQDENILFQVNIFEKKSGATNTLQCYAIRDMVAYHFRPGKDITIYEETGTTSVGKVKIRDVANDEPLPETNELNQYVFAVDMQWTRLVAK